MLAPFQTPNLAQPSEGSQAACVTFDFTAATTLQNDFTQDLMRDKIAFIQSVFIDNADNTAPVDLTFAGAPTAQRIRAAALSQGWYPVSIPNGPALRVAAASQGGVKVNVIFANFAMPYVVWGPASGVTVTPPLTNKALNALNFAGGDNQQLVAGVALESVKLYRGMFSVDSPTILTWTDGPGGTVLFAANLTAGGSATFQASGIAWFNTSAGNDLTLHSSAACNVYGGFGYAQS